MEAGEAIRKTLLELLAIDSDNRADKSAILAYVTERLEGCGMRVDRIGGSDTPAVLATVGGGGVVLSGHLDTVPIGEGWSRRQGEIDGDRVYGRGAADMKGAVAAMLHATAELAENDVPCSVALTTDEEERMLGAREIAKRPEIISSKGIVICEPTGLDIACREKGVFRFRLRTRGKAAHSSQSWLGDNAIMRMHQALSRLTDLAQTPSAPTDGLTMCFATIRGGTKNNVVPDRCETEIDARFPAPDTPDSIGSLIHDRLRGLQYEVEVIYGLEAFNADPESWIPREISRLLGTRIISVPYAAEAPRYARANTSICICGPGEASMAHVVDEYVEVSKMARAYEMLVHLGRVAQG